VRVGPCRAEDIGPLEAGVPSGLSRFHERRLARQQQGISSYLIAWVDDVPAGHAVVRWDGCEPTEVRQRFPGCAMISALEVWPGHMRSRGIGTALIAEAERRAAARGFSRIGPGVADDNPRAAALYLRLGFEETGYHYLDQYEVIDADAVRHAITESCRFLVRHLARRPAAPERPAAAERPTAPRPSAEA
jgi:GNAT superfamily N-acetyltransferase